MPTCREQLGCWLHERWRTELVLRTPALAARLGLTWLDLCNRHESLTKTDGGRARVCNWRDTSPLTVCRVFPETGGRLLRHCLRQWPVCFANAPNTSPTLPSVSIIIAFRGTDRLPQLHACLATLWGQQGVSLEIILVEQSWEPLLDEHLLAGVRIIHARSTTPEMPFNKSWALNVGARQARADILIFHDADMLAPAGYVSAVLELIKRGFDGARVSRLVFYLDPETSSQMQQNRAMTPVRVVEDVRQNCPAGSLAMSKATYWNIGGHDESFYGWGGEDDEILERAETLRFYPGGFLPFVHLWHPSQLEKYSDSYEREDFTLKKLATPVNERIARLIALIPGDPAAPPGGDITMKDSARACICPASPWRR